MPDRASKSHRYTFCFSSFMYNNLQNSRDRTLIIDTRNVANFNERHIEGSINLATQRIEEALEKESDDFEQQKLSLPNLMKLLRSNESSKFSQRRRCFCFLVVSENSLPRRLINEIKGLAKMKDYDDSFQLTEDDFKNVFDHTFNQVQEKNSVLNALEIFKTLQNDKVRELYLLLDGASSFFERYPFLAVPKNQINEKNSSYASSGHSCECSFPHDILDGRLFLGSFNQSEKYSLVSDLKITHILNMTLECENAHEDKGINYHKIAILDEDSTNIAVHFEEAYEFIDQTLQKNNSNKVFVHCAMGKSRSATIVIMYLMKRFLWNYEQAFAFVKRKREVVSPNEGFVQQLQEFENVNIGLVNPL